MERSIRKFLCGPPSQIRQDSCHPKISKEKPSLQELAILLEYWGAGGEKIQELLRETKLSEVVLFINEGNF